MKNFFKSLEKVDARYLYLFLVVATSIPFLWAVEIPVDPDPSSKDFYASVMAVPPEQTVFIQSDWTNSTRGENAGHMESLYRILMNKGHKIVVYALGDPQAPQVYRDVMLRINVERESQGLEPYKPWLDYVDLGYFPNAEGTSVSIGNDIRKTFGTRRIKDDKGVERNVFESPPLKGIKGIKDAGLLVIVTASNTIDYAVQRLSDKVKMACMCTGVIGPTALTYYQAGQLTGVGVGLKGVYDVEYMMVNGLNQPNKDGKIVVRFPQKSDVSAPPMELRGKQVQASMFGRGARYYLSLHAALALVISAVVIGNLGMYFNKKIKGAKS